MDCQAVRSRLISFHFANLEEDTRTLMEAHLISCPECVKGFLGVKRAVEAGLDADGARRDLGEQRARWATRAEAGVVAAVVAALVLGGAMLLDRGRAGAADPATRPEVAERPPAPRPGCDLAPTRPPWEGVDPATVIVASHLRSS